MLTRLHKGNYFNGGLYDFKENRVVEIREDGGWGDGGRVEEIADCEGDVFENSG